MSNRFLNIGLFYVGIAVLQTSGSSLASAFEQDRTVPLLGIYVGNDPADVRRAESWLMRRVDGVRVATGDRDWEDWSSSITWQLARWKGLGRTIFWSIPLFPRGGSLTEAASGAYDSRYWEAAAHLANAYATESKIYVRTGWEFNGGWMHWSAKGQERAYIDAFRRFVTSFRKTSDRFVFEWAPNIGDFGVNPEEAYPGDAYVDVIGLDFYYDLRWDPPDPVQAWRHMVSRRFGLDWHQRFAKTRGKPTAYSEWGVMSEQASVYINFAADWFKEHRVLYHIYWESNADFPGKLSEGQYSGAGEAFKRAFSQ